MTIVQVRAERRERELRDHIENLEADKEELQRQVDAMETAAMDVVKVPSQSNPDRPPPKTSSGTSLQPRDKSGKWTKAKR